MDYKLTKLENGIRVITVPLPNLESATVTVWAGVGSRFEDKEIGGISHFLEHMVFKGSKKRPSAKLISEAIDAFGGEFNASTSKDWTNFYIKARSAKIDTAFDVLSDMVLNPLLKSSDIEREKGVIIEEIGMYEDTPIAKIDDIFEQLIFRDHELGRDVIGTRKSVKNIKRSDFTTFRKTHYGSGNIVVTVSGGIKEKDVLKLCNLYLSEVKPSKGKDIEKFESKQKNPVVLLKNKAQEQAHFMLGFLANPRGHNKRFSETVLSAVLGGGMSSRLFTEVREKRGLAYAVKSSIDRYNDIGHFSTYVGADIRRIDEAIKVTLDEHYKLAEKKVKITKPELKKAKEYLKGHLALSLEDTKAVNAFFGVRELLLGEIETPDEVYKRIDKVNTDEVYDIAKELFVPERLNLAIIGPFKDEKRFERILR